MDVTLLYFDGCPNWRVAEQNLRWAAAEVGISDVRVRRRRVETDEEAERLGFAGSPTILLDGVDPFAEFDAPVSLSCRLYRTPSGMAGAPTTAQLRDAIELHERS